MLIRALYSRLDRRLCIVIRSSACAACGFSPPYPPCTGLCQPWLLDMINEDVSEDNTDFLRKLGGCINSDAVMLNQDRWQRQRCSRLKGLHTHFFRARTGHLVSTFDKFLGTDALPLGRCWISSRFVTFPYDTLTSRFPDILLFLFYFTSSFLISFLGVKQSLSYRVLSLSGLRNSQSWLNRICTCCEHRLQRTCHGGY